jgi:acyl-CoA reductase-like NAD-dependent aldehyde dehydrogenase
MVEFTKALKVGNGFEPGIFVGPVQDLMQSDKVIWLLQEAEKEKWIVALRGVIDASPRCFTAPTTIDRPPDDSSIVVEESFGSSSILLFRSLDRTHKTETNISTYLVPIVELLS